MKYRTEKIFKVNKELFFWGKKSTDERISSQTREGEREREKNLIKSEETLQLLP